MFQRVVFPVVLKWDIDTLFVLTGPNELNVTCLKEDGKAPLKPKIFLG